MYYWYHRASSTIKASYLDPTGVALNGFRVIPTPDEVSIDEDVSPFDLAELLSQKYGGVLADQPQFAHVAYDDLVNPASWNIADPSTRGGVGNGEVFLSIADGLTPGYLQTTVIDVSGDGAFSKFSLHWDIATIASTEVGGRAVRTMTAEDPDVVNVLVSNDGGVTFLPALFGEEISFAGSGNQLILRFENPSLSNRYHIQGFGILY